MIQEPKTITSTIHRRVVKLMGNGFEFSVVAESADWAEEQIDKGISEIVRIERLFTTFNEESQVQLINRNAGITPVKVDREVIDLIARSKKISGITQGAFDITYGSIEKTLWNFDTSMTSLPDAETARRSVHLINYHNVIIDEKEGTVFLKNKGMRINFGGIGKGYAAEMAKKVMKSNGVLSAVVNASGDLTAWGTLPDGKPWTIGIADPSSRQSIFSKFSISEMAVATSGNYEKFIMIDGKRYSHTIDPKTGLPVNGIKSVTIICPNAEIADAMATPVMIMGVKAAIDMVNQVKYLACILVDDNDDIHTSNNINLKT
jgi:thiamine biosynthesis lipoprotein